MSRKIGFLSAILMLASCGPHIAEPVTDVSVRLPAVAGRPGVAYFTLHGGDTGRTLISVTSPAADRAEMHEAMMSGNMASMGPITGNVAVAAKSEVQFESGGKHLMLFGLRPTLKPGDPVELTFIFANGEKITRAATAEPPGGGETHSH